MKRTAIRLLAAAVTLGPLSTSCAGPYVLRGGQWAYDPLPVVSEPFASEPLPKESAVEPETGTTQGAAGPAGQPVAGAETAAPLYGWDGGVVSEPQAGGQSAARLQAHTLEPPVPGRMHILELYQNVIDERDALADQVDELRRLLGEARTRIDASGGTTRELEERALALEEANAALRAELEELSSRLVTAQIRRLEAEKMLLEARIETARQAAPAGAKGDRR